MENAQNEAPQETIGEKGDAEEDNTQNASLQVSWEEVFSSQRLLVTKRSLVIEKLKSKGYLTPTKLQSDIMSHMGVANNRMNKLIGIGTGRKLLALLPLIHLICEEEPKDEEEDVPIAMGVIVTNSLERATSIEHLLRYLTGDWGVRRSVIGRVDVLSNTDQLKQCQYLCIDNAGQLLNDQVVQQRCTALETGTQLLLTNYMMRPCLRRFVADQVITAYGKPKGETVKFSYWRGAMSISIPMTGHRKIEEDLVEVCGEDIPVPISAYSDFLFPVPVLEWLNEQSPGGLEPFTKYALVATIQGRDMVARFDRMPIALEVLGVVVSTVFNSSFEDAISSLGLQTLVLCETQEMTKVFYDLCLDCKKKFGFRDCNRDVKIIMVGEGGGEQTEEKRTEENNNDWNAWPKPSQHPS